MKTIKTLSAVSLLIFSSCSSRSANVAQTKSITPVTETNDINWRDSDDAKFIGTMWVTLF